MTIGDGPDGPFQIASPSHSGTAPLRAEGDLAGAGPRSARPAEALAAALGLPLESEGTVDVVHSADMHGQMEAMPYLATVVKRHRADHPHALVLDSGDWARGSEVSNLFKGKPMIEIMNHIGYTAAGVGEGDIAWGVKAFLERVAEARFPIVAANLRDSEGRPLPGVHPHHVVEVGGRRVGIIGLCCRDCERPGQTRVLDPRAALLEAMYTLRASSVDTFIVLSHLGHADDRALAAAVPGIHCILGGHDHVPVSPPDQVGDTLLSCPDADARSVATLSFRFGAAVAPGADPPGGGTHPTTGGVRPPTQGGETR